MTGTAGTEATLQDSRPQALTTALVGGPRYLLSLWPWRAALSSLLLTAVSCAVIVGIVPVLILGMRRSLRAALWHPLLEFEASRLALLDPRIAAGFRRDISVAHRTDRLPSSRHVGYLLVIALFAGPLGAIMVAFLGILDSVLIAAPWLVDDANPINVGPWSVRNAEQAWWAMAFGIVCVIFSAYLIGAFSVAVGQLASAILLDAPRLHREVAQLTDSRTALLHAVEHERRRIEADLHDRVQHRLVALAVTLGIAENAHGQDPTGRLAAEAHAQLDTALAELRSVIRGIQPRTLTEYGLVAAAVDLIATFPLPVESNFGSTETSGRLPPQVEQVAYLIVTEALTNVAKHAAATTVAITADRDENSWWITLRDDGIGNARVRSGHGLDALRNHLGAMGGTLTITSPPGGPTEITMRCPLS